MPYLLITSTGKTAPIFEHPTLDSAEKEARRLCALHDCSVKIVEVIAVVYKKTIPSVVIKTHSEWLKDMIRPSPDDLAF